MSKPVFDKLLGKLVEHDHKTSFNAQQANRGGGGGGSKSYSPATKIVAPQGSVERADYYTSGAGDDVQIQTALNDASALGGGKVFLRKGTYNTSAVIRLPSNVTLEGEDASSTIVKLAPNRNVSVFTNSDQTNGNSFITLRNLTVDQNGTNQTSAGGGFVPTYLTDSTIENVIFNTSYRFNLLILSGPGTTLTGTVTFTNNDATVSGSSTLFSSELSVGSIIKGPGGRFGRVLSITSNISLELEQIWGFDSESGTARVVLPNSNNKMINCIFNGSLNTDNVGLGLCDDSLVQGNISRDSGGGYGFGPDHCKKIKFIGNSCLDNYNDGIGAETCTHSVFNSNICEGNGGNGIRLLSGAFRNIVSSNQLRRNVNGLSVGNISALFDKPNENTLIGNICELNSGNGMIISGASKTQIIGNKCFNNGSFGIALGNDGTSTASDYCLVNGNHCFDDQPTKTQDAGIRVGSGIGNMLIGNQSLDIDHVNSANGIVDLGTNTLIQNSQSGSDAHFDGALQIYNSTNPGIGLSVYSNYGAGATAALAVIKADNTAFDRDAVTITNDSTSAATAALRVNGGSGFASILDSNSTSVAGTIVRNSTATRNGTGINALFSVRQDATSASGDVANIRQLGTGKVITIDNDGNGNSIDIDQDTSSTSTAVAVAIDLDNLSTGGAIGIDVASVTSSGGQAIGVRIAAPSNAGQNFALQLSDTTGNTSGGITFGNDIQLYRSAANTLRLDDKLFVRNQNLSGAGIEIDRDGAADTGEITGLTVDVDNAGYIGNSVGIDVSNITGSATNAGVRVAAPSGGTANYAIQLSDTGGTSAGGLTFGTDTNLYRDAANSLKTDDNFAAANVLASTYTPTRSAEANLDSNVTPSEAQYMRVGNTVTVSGMFTADPTLTATATSFELTLPVASNIGAIEDLAGVAFCGAIAGQGAAVSGSVANNTAVVSWVSSDITSQAWSYTFTYQVI